ncbi:MAG: phage tail protein [Microvirga sp.]
MSTGGGTYRFKSREQWQACLSTAIPEPLRLEEARGEEIREIPGEVRLFAASPDGEMLWAGADGALRYDGCAGPRLGDVRRLIVGRRTIWAFDGARIAQLDRASLQVLQLIDPPRIADIAPDRSDGLWLLADTGLMRMDDAGRIASDRSAPRLTGDRLAAVGGTLVVLDVDRSTLQLWRGAGSVLTIGLAKILGPDAERFAADELAGGRSSLLLTGSWPGPRPGFLLLDPAGEPRSIGQWQEPAPVRVVIEGDDLLALFTADGRSRIRRFTGAGAAGGQVWLTPSLETDTLAGDWLRADVLARLPEGVTLELRSAATSDAGLRTTVDSVFGDETQPVGDRIRVIADLLEPCWSRKRVYAGERRETPATTEPYALPLHEAAGNMLWIELALHRNQVGESAEVGSLAVHHDAASLIDNLPAIYRGPGGDADGTLRPLVAVLETTTQSIDELISHLAERLDPDLTEDRWLPQLAALLGLPFDAELLARAQRSLLKGARAILAGRGALAGVHALLNAIFGARRFVVVDRSEQLAPIALGGGGFSGSRLPAFLGGPSVRVPKLNARLVLGTTPLCTADTADASLARPPELLVVIPASGTERRRYGAAVQRMLEEMIPAGVRLRLRWTAMQQGLVDAADVVTVVAEPLPLRLGDGQALGAARLGSDGRLRLRDGGVTAEHRLP